jgi:hypothetical protein
MGLRRRDVIQYCSDIKQFSRMYPWALFRPSIVRGYFDAGEQSRYQQIFFDALVRAGFKRTRWQLVLPGQTAGLVKRVAPDPQGANQYHVRFYRDGTIDCELEHHNFHIRHWSGARRRGADLLEGILHEVSPALGDAYLSDIRSLFGTKEYHI